MSSSNLLFNSNLVSNSKVLIFGRSYIPRKGIFMKHRGRMLGLLIVIIFLATANACQATTVTVEPGQRIQAAIDSARPGDVIRVEKGLYNENLNISKRVTLVGIEMPMLDAKAAGSAITIQAEGVNVTGFELRNSRRSGIAIFSKNNSIKGNNISGCNDGIRAENSITIRSQAIRSTTIPTG